MKKVLKIAGIVIGAFLAFAILLVLTMPLWIGPVVKTVANAAVPQLTRTEFGIDGFSFNLYNGRLEISGVRLFNPKEFDQKMAFTLGKVFVDVDMSTVFSDPMVIEKIEVKDVFASYLDGSHGTNNFDIITANVKDSLGIESEPDEPEDDEVAKSDDSAKSDDNAKSDDVAKSDDKEEAEDDEEDGASGRKFIIDDLLIDSVVVQYGAVTLPLKVPIHITAIGRDLGGINAENAWKEIFSQFWRSLTNIGQGILSLGSAGIDKASELFKGLTSKDETDSSEKSTSGVVDKASESVNKAAESIKGLFK